MYQEQTANYDSSIIAWSSAKTEDTSEKPLHDIAISLHAPTILVFSHKWENSRAHSTNIQIPTVILNQQFEINDLAGNVSDILKQQVIQILSENDRNKENWMKKVSIQPEFSRSATPFRTPECKVLFLNFPQNKTKRYTIRSPMSIQSLYIYHMDIISNKIACLRPIVSFSASIQKVIIDDPRYRSTVLHMTTNRINMLEIYNSICSPHMTIQNNSSMIATKCGCIINQSITDTHKRHIMKSEMSFKTLSEELHVIFAIRKMRCVFIPQLEMAVRMDSRRALETKTLYTPHIRDIVEALKMKNANQIPTMQTPAIGELKITQAQIFFNMMPEMIEHLNQKNKSEHPTRIIFRFIVNTRSRPGNIRKIEQILPIYGSNPDQHNYYVYRCILNLRPTENILLLSLIPLGITEIHLTINDTDENDIDKLIPNDPNVHNVYKILPHSSFYKLYIMQTSSIESPSSITSKDKMGLSALFAMNMSSFKKDSLITKSTYPKDFDKTSETIAMTQINADQSQAVESRQEHQYKRAIVVNETSINQTNTTAQGTSADTMITILSKR